MYDPATGQFDFGIALKSLHDGKRVSREIWEGGWIELEGRRIRFCVPTKATVVRMPFRASSEDLLAEDWYEVI